MNKNFLPHSATIMVIFLFMVPSTFVAFTDTLKHGIVAFILLSVFALMVDFAIKIVIWYDDWLNK